MRALVQTIPYRTWDAWRFARPWAWYVPRLPRQSLSRGVEQEFVAQLIEDRSLGGAECCQSSHARIRGCQLPETVPFLRGDPMNISCFCLDEQDGTARVDRDCDHVGQPFAASRLGSHVPPVGEPVREEPVEAATHPSGDHYSSQASTTSAVAAGAGAAATAAAGLRAARFLGAAVAAAVWASSASSSSPLPRMRSEIVL